MLPIQAVRGLLRLDPHLLGPYTQFLAPTQIHIPDRVRIWISSTVFAGLTVGTDGQTDRQTALLASAARCRLSTILTAEGCQ